MLSGIDEDDLCIVELEFFIQHIQMCSGKVCHMKKILSLIIIEIIVATIQHITNTA